MEKNIITNKDSKLSIKFSECNITGCAELTNR